MNKTSSDHIGLLIYNVFNASIPSRAISKEFMWDEDSNVWKSIAENDADSVSITRGSLVQFAVSK